VKNIPYCEQILRSQSHSMAWNSSDVFRDPQNPTQVHSIYYDHRGQEFGDARDRQRLFDVASYHYPVSFVVHAEDRLGSDARFTDSAASLPTANSHGAAQELVQRTGNGLEAYVSFALGGSGRYRRTRSRGMLIGGRRRARGSEVHESPHIRGATHGNISCRRWRGGWHGTGRLSGLNMVSVYPAQRKNEFPARDPFEYVHCGPS